MAMTVSPRSRKLLSAVAVMLTFSLGLADQAEARRGGGFGSRGMRTYSAPRMTNTAPRQAAPIQRSMTPREAASAPGQVAAPRPGMAPQPQRGGFLRRWGGPILGGLLLGGLFGMLMGHGFGGAAGMLGLIVQLGLIALVIGVVMAIFRRRQPTYAGMSGPAPREAFGGSTPFPSAQPTGFDRPIPSAPVADTGDEIEIGQGDLDTFERMLTDLQSAFGREDYAALRELTTPEVMSFLAEEMSANAVAGRRNEVKDVRLLQGDLAEAWREGGKDYATVAMRYSSIDVMRDRATSAVVDGDPDRPTETTEIWTFVRDREGPWGPRWKLSAIQDLEPAQA
jgi:predicted lipid-binding transport protein (Tim44 family)